MSFRATFIAAAILMAAIGAASPAYSSPGDGGCLHRRIRRLCAVSTKGRPSAANCHCPMCGWKLVVQ